MNNSNAVNKESLIDEFGYLIEKIKSSNFNHDPFKFLIIDDFLSTEHFRQVTSAEEINRPEVTKTENLIDDLLKHGYEVQSFPGCTTSIKDYLACYNSKKWPTDKNLLEGFGLTFRLKKYETPILQRLVQFLNLPEFQSAIAEKFSLEEPTHVETAIQKYFHGYEISPHPDIRRKAATYMLNINTSDDSEQINIHTYLMKFKKSKEYVYDFWKQNEEIERNWVPWDWCESKFETRKNNSIVLFAPSDDTLHAVKLDYDHLKFQRTQVYGNLWYNESKVKYTSTYNDLSSSNDIDITRIKQLNKIKEDKSLKTAIKSIIPNSIKKAIKNI